VAVLKRSSRKKQRAKLPSAEPIRRVLAEEFRRQAREVRAFLGLGRKALEPWIGGADNPFRLGQLRLAERMTPVLESYWDRAGTQFMSRIGLDPDRWSVVNPHTADKIRTAALDLAQSTLDTTEHDVARALALTREELERGIVTEGETLDRLTERIQRVFQHAETFRARRIATTETSRAVHAAQEEAAIQSGVVTGWEWLLSDDACPICQEIASEVGAVRLGDLFAVVGDHATYANVAHPPAHVNCQCTMSEVLDDEPQPRFAEQPILQPGSEADDDIGA
jgi:hypothetical protein